MADKLDFIIGAADELAVDARLAQLGARAQSAELMEKPLRFFHRECGKDWATAPFRYRCSVASYSDLQRCLDKSRRLWGAFRLRQEEIPSAGQLDCGDFGSLEWGTTEAKTAACAPGEASVPPHGIEDGDVARPASVAQVAPVAEETAAAAARAVGDGDAASVRERVLAFICAQTGYKPSDLAPERDWELDLAVDSLKLATMLARLWEEFGLGGLTDIDIADYPTVGHLLTYLEAVSASRAALAAGEASAVREDAIAGPQNSVAGAESAGERGGGSQVALEVNPVVEVGVLRGEAESVLLSALADSLGEPLSELRLRSVEGWLHLQEDVRQAAAEGLRASYVVTTASHPLLGRLVCLDDEGRLHHLGQPYLEPLEVMSWIKYRMEGRENAWYYCVGALMAKFLDEVSVAQPSAPGPKIFLSNHQTALEGYIFPLLAPIVTGLSLQGVAMLDHGVDWADAMSDFMFSHGYFPRHLLGPKRGFVFGDTWGLLRLLPGLEKDMASRHWGLHIVASGQREWVARQRLTEVSSVWIEMALRLGLPLVPVRFSGGVPLDNPEKAQDFPVGLGRQKVCFGAELSHASLANLSSRVRKTRVLQALNDFNLEEERPCQPDPDFAAEWQATIARFQGHPVAALLLCCLQRWISVEQELARGQRELPSCLQALLLAAAAPERWREPVTLVLPNNPDGRWVGTLARLAFGERGPRVCMEGEADVSQAGLRVSVTES